MPQFQYKEQKFQQDAVSAVVDVFRGIDFSLFLRNDLVGAPLLAAPTGSENAQPENEFLPTFRDLLESNLNDIQKRNNIRPDLSLDDEPYLMLDTHMETGTGKTFTFINTIFELHKKYACTHFVVIVPSIAIKEGIKKSFATTAVYFERLYQQRIEVHEMKSLGSVRGRKSPSSGLMSFVYGQGLTVLILTNHSFNRSDNIINQELEGFYADDARTPMEAIAAKNPVLIIDEPQRVEGPQTIDRIKNFSPMFVLRYSATFRAGQIKNLVYALDSYDAFHTKLVKGISVTDYKTGITDSAFLGVRRIFHKNGKLVAELTAVNQEGNLLTVAVTTENENTAGHLFARTKNPAYQGLRVTEINNINKTITFSDGCTLKLGEYSGQEAANQNIIAEVMLRDTIDKHLQKEEELYRRGIKCISLIFINRVKDYRDYDAEGQAGRLQKLFEDCYKDCKKKLAESGKLSGEYKAYLDRWTPQQVHGGYFSADAKHNRDIDQGVAGKENETARRLQQEISELILRDKERVLNLDNELRFIFAHSALREGWDNPNVFQICKLRDSFSETSVVQEVGRGLRICVNQKLVRQDSEAVGGEFFTFNTLDIFTLGNGEFINRLQAELSQRRNESKKDFLLIDEKLLMKMYDLKKMKAIRLLHKLYEIECVDDDGYLIKKEGVEQILSEEDLNSRTLLSRFSQMPSIGDGHSGSNEPRKYRVSKKHYQSFKELWHLLHQKAVYQVQYSNDLVPNAVAAINNMPEIELLYLHRRRGDLAVKEGGFSGEQQETVANAQITSNLSAQVFLNQLTEKTNLPRNTVIRILSKIKADTFAAMQKNPFVAIQRVADVMNGVIFENIVDNVRYIKLDGARKAETEITLLDKTFTAQHYIELNNLPTYKDNNLWSDIAPYDSQDPERKISEAALADDSIIVFAKLPRTVNIPAPMHPKGINPDFAIVVKKNGESRFYFVAEAKPTTATEGLRLAEQQCIDFMKKYFDGIDASIKFSVVQNYDQLLQSFEQAGTTQ